MLKPHELFPGAVLIYFTAEGHKMLTIADAKTLEWIEECAEQFNLVHAPIPLTPEILTDLCGWNQDKLKVYKPIHSKGVNKIVVGLTKLHGRIEIYQFGEYITALPHVQYLHQLQALYQLLTGEMMPINLPKNQ